MLGKLYSPFESGGIVNIIQHCFGIISTYRFLIWWKLAALEACNLSEYQTSRSTSQVCAATPKNWEGRELSGRGPSSQVGPICSWKSWLLRNTGQSCCFCGFCGLLLLCSCIIRTATPPHAAYLLLPVWGFYSHIKSLEIAKSIFHFAFHLHLSFFTQDVLWGHCTWRHKGTCTVKGWHTHLRSHCVFNRNLIHLWSPTGVSQTGKMETRSKYAGWNTVF